MEVPSWVPFHGVITAFAFLAQFFLTIDTALPSTGGNFLQVLLRLISFTAISGLPGWVSFVFFITLSLPWLLLLAAYAFELAQGSVTGLAAVAVLGVTLLGAAFFL